MCDVEDTVEDWFDKDHYEAMTRRGLKDHIKHHIDDFMVKLSKQFKVEKVLVGGVDYSVWKIYLTTSH